MRESTPASRPPLTWLGRHRAELHLALRITVAGVMAFALAQVLSLPQGYWAVFTAVLVTQASVGGSLTAAFERMIGTIGGGVYGAAVDILVPHSDPVTLGLALALSLAPLAALAAINPTFRVAPVTAVILLLGSAGSQEGPVLAGLLRAMEVALGGLVGLAVSVAVLPKRAGAVMCESSNRLLTLLAALFADLFNGLLAPLDAASISAQHLKIQSTFDRLEAAEKEWNRERHIFLSGEMDLAPLPRTLRRIYHDLVLIGRVASRPLPGIGQTRIEHVLDSGTRFLRDAGNALVHHLSPPAPEEFDAALDMLSKDAEGAHAGEDAERFAVLGFALEQLERDCADLAARISELAKSKSKRD